MARAEWRDMTETEQRFLDRICAIELMAYGHSIDHIPEHLRDDPLVRRVMELHTCWKAQFYKALAEREMQAHIDPLFPKPAPLLD